MNRYIPLYLIAVAVIFGSPPHLGAEGHKEEDDKKKSPHSLTVAILDFQATTPANPELGKQVSEAIAAILSGQDGFTLVDRSSMSQTLAENKLNLTGLVNADQAIKIGKLVGAKILVTGKIFTLDKQLFFTAKLVGTETSLLDGAIVKGNQNANIGELMMQLADKVAVRLREAGPRLIASDDLVEDPIPGLKKALAGHKLPTLAVHIQEHHVTQEPATRIDPAAETEVKIVLKEAGFTIVDGEGKDLADSGVTLIVGGEAFSEFAARIASLISCSARVEIKIIDRKTNEVVYVDREITRGVDLAENIAAKSALQKAGRVLAIRILRHFEKILSEDKGDRAEKEHSEKKKNKADE